MKRDFTETANTIHKTQSEVHKLRLRIGKNIYLKTEKLV